MCTNNDYGIFTMALLTLTLMVHTSGSCSARVSVGMLKGRLASEGSLVTMVTSR